MTKINSRLFLTGDMHGYEDIYKLNSKNFPQQKELTKDDYLIVLGDFGLVWSVNEFKRDEAYWVDWLSTRKFTTIVVLGNHENYDRILKLPEVDMFGGTVWKYTDSIFILKRGAVYNIHGKKFFTMGGAESIDKNIRIPQISWWKEEIPSYEEFDNGMNALADNNNKVDYVITHTAPTRVIVQYMNHCRDVYIDEFKGQYKDGELPEEFYDRITNTFIDKDYFEAKQCAVSDYLNVVIYDNELDFKKLFFGHMHDNWLSKDGRFVMLYNDIIELDVMNGSYR